MLANRLFSLVGLLVGLLSFGAVFWTLPGAQREREIAAFLRSQVAPGELVVVTPAMSLDRLRAYTAAALPAVSAPIDLVLETSRSPRLWVVGPLGTGKSPPPAFGVHLERGHLVANTAVWQLRPTGEYTAKRDSLARLLEGAGVRVRSRDDVSGRGQACRRERLRFRCGTESWQWVGPETVVVQGEPRLCLWAHPMAHKTLSIELPSLDDGTRFRLTTLQSDAAVSHRRGGPIEVKVLARDKGEPPVGASQNAKANTQSDVAPINGTEVSLQKGSEQVLAHIEHPAGLSVLHTDFAPIDADHAVIVELGVDDDGLAHFCIDVEVLP